MKSIEWYKRSKAWAYFTLAIFSFLMAIFTGIVDPSSLEGGGKGGFYLAVFTAVGSLLEPIFGQYGTSVVFLIITIFLLLIWYKKLNSIPNIECENKI